MDSTRRKLLQAAALIGAGQLSACDGRTGAAGRPRRNDDGAGDRPTLLVLGGTGFVGPPIVREAAERGFEVTLFNRGRTNADLFQELELLVGDRDGALDNLEAEIARGRRWGTVVDLSGYQASHVADTAAALEHATDHYLFMSTVSVYASFREANEEDSTTLAQRSADYGPQKARAEREVLARMPAAATILRPAYIVGPGDNTDRFTYWPVRVAQGGDLLVPGPPERPIQFVDVRDLADFVVRCAELRLLGRFNTVIPAGSYSMQELIDDCQTATGTTVAPTWVSPEFVAANALDNGTAFPIWSMPGGEWESLPLTSGERAASQGFVTRPPLETLRDLVSWWRSLPATRQSRMGVGLTRAKEAELLAEWRTRGA